MTYANIDSLDKLIENAVSSIEAGQPLSELATMIKNAPTGILLASADHAELRYQPGNKLVTYNGVDSNGKPIQETYGGGVAEIKLGSVILVSEGTLTYPEGHRLSGQTVLGSYLTDGTFKVD